MNPQHEQQLLEKKIQSLRNQYIWPAAIPMEVKEYCLEDFSNNMSMSALRQATCIICNVREYANTMKECSLQGIPNSERLSCHIDLMDIIPTMRQVTHSKHIKPLIIINILVLFVVDEHVNSSFFSLSNLVFYKKGYNTITKTGNICQKCYAALVKDTIPVFSAANKDVGW